MADERAPDFRIARDPARAAAARRSARPSRFRSNAVAAACVLALLTARAGIAVLGAAYAFEVRGWYPSLDRAAGPGVEMPPVPVGSEFRLWTWLATIVVYLMWLHRAALNAQVISRRNLRLGPGAAVASFLIPFVNLVRPYGALREIWFASLGPVEIDRPAGRRVGLVGWWWGVFLASFAIPFVVAIVWQSRTRAPEPHRDVALVTDVAFCVLHALAAALCASVVVSIQLMQRRAHRAGPAAIADIFR